MRQQTKKRCLLAVCLLAMTLGQATADVCRYEEDFTTDPGLSIATSPASNAESFIDHAVLGASSPAGQAASGSGVFFRGDYGSNAVSTSNGFLNISGTANAGRTVITGVYIDTSSWVAGQYDLAFDIASFSNVNAVDGDEAAFSIYEGSGVDGTAANVLTTQFGRGANVLNLGPRVFTTQGTAVAPTQIGGLTAITGDGTVSLSNFALSEAGVAGDYVVLYWASRSSSAETVDTSLPSFTVDNIKITELTTVPEPSTLALLGFCGVGLVFRRKRI